MPVPPTVPYIIVPPVEVAQRTVQRMKSAARNTHLPLGIRWESTGPASVEHELAPGVWGVDGRVIGRSDSSGYWEVEFRVHEDMVHGHRVEALVEHRAIPQRTPLTDVHLQPLFDERDLLQAVFGLVKDVCRVAKTPETWTPAEVTRAEFSRPSKPAPRAEPTIAEERGELPLGGRRVA